MEIATFKVKKDNLMYFLYNDHFSIVIDPLDPFLLKQIINVKALNKEVYKTVPAIKNSELLKTPRILKYAFYTHNHPRQHLYDNIFDSIFPDTIFVSGFSDIQCKNKQIYEFDGVKITCIHTPCYTMDSFCYCAEIGKTKYLFTGNTLFFLGCGRFFEGSAENMYTSMRNIIENVDGSAECKYGHDYKDGDITIAETMNPLPIEIKNKDCLTLAEELKFNEFFRAAQLPNKKEAVGKLELLRAIKDKFALGNSIIWDTNFKN